MRRGAALLALLLALCGVVWAEPTRDMSPGEPQGRVNDRAGLLRGAEAWALEQTLIRYERRTEAAGRKTQLVVVTLPGLGGASIEDASMQLAERWRIGTREDRGALLVVAPRERKLRIEVGYGLEGSLQDAVASRIIREIIAPPLAAGQPYAALHRGVVAMHQALAGEPVTGVDPQAPEALAPRDQLGQEDPAQRRGRPGGLWLIGGALLLLLLFGGRGGRGFLLGMLLGNLFGRGGGGWGGGGGGGNSGGGFSGGGGGFGGGGASGDY